jgi:hypothetical protein
MRTSYLESYYNLLPLSQQNRLLKILQDRSTAPGQAASNASTQGQLEALIAQLKTPLGSPMIKLRKAPRFGKISSKDYNDTMDETYVDLGALYKQDNLINSTIKTHEQINDAVLRDVQAAMEKIDNDITVHKIVKENKTGITDAVYNSFYKKDNQSTDPVFAATTEVQTNAIKLPKGLDQSSLVLGGLSLSDINVYYYGGGIKGTIQDQSHNIEKAVDGSSLTFWGECILTDEPIRQVYNNEVQFGAICEIVIDLFRADQINHITFDPFSNYPLSILAIYYAETISGEWIDLNVDPQRSASVMEFNFSEVKAKRVMIVVNQRDASINTYKIPRQVINNAQLWQQIADREYSISTETSAPIQATQDMIDYVTGWQAYVDASQSFEKTLKKAGDPSNYSLTGSISESIYDATTEELAKAGDRRTIDYLKMNLYGTKPPEASDLISVRKYEYVYGSYEIDIRKVWYVDTGEYISPRYTANSTIIEAELNSSDIIPSGCSIEYQVATRPSEWKNILTSDSYITKERLDIDGNTYTGYLRFPCSGSIDSLYRNDRYMEPGYYTYTPSDSSVLIDSSIYIPTASYTVSYVPDGVNDAVPSGVMVSFRDDSLQSSSEMHMVEGSRQYKVELNHYPYINYEIINSNASGVFTYDSGRWLNASGVAMLGVEPGEYYDVLTVTVDGYSSENRTDYYNGVKPALTSYNESTYPFYEYIHAGRNLYFNSELSGKEIRASYVYLNDFIQLRALLRNNVKGNVSVTPIIEDFTIKLRTI